MCGIVGIVGKLGLKDEATIQRLLLLDYFRGIHSTGFASVDGTNHSVAVSKIGSNPIDLFGLKSFQEACNGYRSRVFLGHNRHATKGKVSTVNAHPFEVDHIVGVHNGTLDYESHKRLEEALGEQFEVDSHALISAIARLGINEAISLCEEGRDSHTGAWALVWWDGNDKTLNFLRNKHRPLWFAYDEKFDRMLFASEHEHISMSVGWSKPGYKLHKDKDGFGFWQFTEDTHYVLDPYALGHDKHPKPKTKKLKGREATRAVGYVPFVMRDTSGTTSTTATKTNSNQRTGCSTTALIPRSSSTTTYRHSTNNKPRDCIQLNGTSASPLAGVISEVLFDTISKSGCWFCSAPVEITTPGIAILEKDDIVLCPKCNGQAVTTDSTPRRIYLPGAVFDQY